MPKLALNPRVLKAVPLFSSFSDPQLDVVLASAQHCSYSRRTFIVRAGEKTDALYIILSGHAKVLIPDNDGHEIILSRMGPNDFFGEMALLDDQPRSAAVETIEPCETVRISRTEFMNCLNANIGLATLIMRNLVKRLREADRMIESLALVDVYGRVARLLIKMAQQVNGQWIVTHVPPKQEIAQMIGATRETVSRVVTDLQRKHLIAVEKRRIVVLDSQSMLKRIRSGHHRGKRLQQS